MASATAAAPAPAIAVAPAPSPVAEVAVEPEPEPEPEAERVEREPEPEEPIDEPFTVQVVPVAEPSADPGIREDIFSDPDDVGGAARRGVLRTVLASIALGIGALAIALATRDVSSSAGRRLAIGSVLVLALYGAVAMLLRWQLADRRVRPRFTEEAGDTRAILVGIAVGILGAVLVVALNSLIAGRLTSDTTVVVVLFERAWIHVAVMIFIAVVAAPITEELLFRGLLVEAFRSRGRTTAVLAGALAFAAWHLNPAVLRYYVLMGFLLGFLYWRFGLSGSITAHATFNAVLVVFAFAAISGSPETVSGAQVSLKAPPGWQVVDDRPSPTVDLALEAPNGAAMVIQHVDRGLTNAVTPSAASLGTNIPLPPGIENRRPVQISGGDGVRFSVTGPDGIRAESIVTQRGTRSFIVTFVSGGSAQAERQLEDMLPTITLPAS
jgi:membrane protease YdiL (CAAX protease family)